MYLNGYQCDNCEKIHNIGNIIDAHHYDMCAKLPEGWQRVQEKDKPVRHFCSMSCLYQWSSNAIRANEKQWKYNKDHDNWEQE